MAVGGFGGGEFGGVLGEDVEEDGRLWYGLVFMFIYFSFHM